MEKESIPTWLQTEDQYIPSRDKDAFIDKSILSLANLLSRAVSSRSTYIEKGRVLPELKVFSLFSIILLVSLSKGFVFTLSVLVILLIILASLEGEDIIRTLKVSLSAAAFSFMILLPSVYFYGVHSCMVITLKVFVSVMAVNILASTTRWDNITRAVKIMLVPDIFILVLDVSLRYIVLLGELSLEMFHALKLRSIGKNHQKRSSLSGIAGSIFLSSRAMADEMYAAMTCRCFTGDYHIRKGFRFGIYDVLFLMCDAGIVWFFFICRSIL